MHRAVSILRDAGMARAALAASLLAPAAVSLVLALPRVAGAARTYGEQVVERTLPNGFEMILLPDHKAPVAVVQVWYRVGARNEIPGVTGLSHMLEHMMFKGTAKTGPEEYSRIIARNGGNENAFTSDDATTYFATLASDRIGVALELEADRMRNLVLDEQRFEPERRVVMEERRMRVDDNPVSFMMESLGAATFLDHPYRLPIIGWAKDIEGWKLEDLRRHYDTYYQPNNAFLVAVGDFDPEALAEVVAEHFGDHPRGAEPPPVRATEPEPRGAKRIWVERPAKLPYLVTHYHVPNLHHPDSPALEMLQAVLSSGKSSRLFSRLVHAERVALEVDASYDRTSLDDKTFTLAGQPPPGVPLEKLERAIEREIAAIQSEPPSAEELARARAQIEASFVFAQDSMFYRALMLGTYEIAGGWRQVDDFLPSMASVTPEDVQRVARIYLVEKNRTTGILVPQAIDGDGEGKPEPGPVGSVR